MFRTRYVLLVLALMAAASFVTYALPGKDKVNLTYDLDFEMRFDNREFYRSRFSESMTIFGARLTPSVGVQVVQDNGLRHRLMVGIDVMKDFGDSTANRELFRELTIYYNVQKQVGDNGLELYAGIYPRKFLDGRWTQAFFSDSLSFYDNKLEGILLKLKRPKAHFELGADWMGLTGEYRRERFMIFSSGEGQVLPFTSFGYSFYVYHYAGSRKVRGVVDNILINPYAVVDMGEPTGMQRLKLTFGWIQALQNDRRNIGRYVFPGGGEIDFEAGHWNLGLRNRMYIGRDLMPYYNRLDAGGFKYGSNDLYLGDPFYRVNDRGEGKVGTYDRLEIFYAPKIGRYLSINISAILHFNEFHYSGFQQMVGVRFNLNELINRKR